jgi:dihydrofolate reductase
MMSSSVLYMSMSFDGFIAGPDVHADQGLGEGGERLHEWLGIGGHPAEFGPSGPSREVFDELMATGAVVTGRQTFDFAGQWGGDHHDGVPIFVVVQGDVPSTPYDNVHYVTDGVESAMAQAKEAAGEADVMVHGATLAQLMLRARVLDELEIQLIPVLLGGGRSLFGELGEQVELELARVVETPGVTHMRYRVLA